MQFKVTKEWRTVTYVEAESTDDAYSKADEELRPGGDFECTGGWVEQVK